MEDATKSSALSPVITKLFIGYFGTKALNNAQFNLKISLRNDDDIVIIRLFGQ